MKRFWEVDFFRGLAIVLMIIFNYSFALSYLNIFSLSLGWLYWYLFPRFIGGMFIFISGLSQTLGYGTNKKDFHKKSFSRGFKIFGLGILITIATYLTFPEAYVIFGILQFIGISIILGQFFLRYKRLNLLIGASLFVLGLYLQNFSFDFPWLLWLGFIPQNFFTFDYWPLLPWFGVTLIGIYFGKILYDKGKRNFKIKELSNNFAVKALSFLGRNSLTIYLLHQLLLVIALMLLGFRIL
jgi:uncharacterized membrane protein